MSATTHIKIILIGLFLGVLSACSTLEPAKPAPSGTGAERKPELQEPQISEHAFNTNQACIDIIKEYEGVRLQAYIGPGGHWLIGYGHKATAFEGRTITAQKAEDILRADLNKFEAAVKRLVNVPINHNQFSALVCLSYNIGSGNFARSTLLRELNQSNYTEASDQFKVWRMVNGKINQHQVKRRAVEKALFDRE